MSAWDLPKSTIINGAEYAIRSDYRAALDILSVLEDSDLSNGERGHYSMMVFYPDYPENMPRSDCQQAIEYMQWFLGGGDMKGSKPKSKLADWKQDFPLIVNPVNRVLGFEVRDCEYCHWWTFLAAYYEIGDCLFAQVVSIRKKRRQGKKLDKWEREFYRDNRELVDLKTEYTDDEVAFFKEWGLNIEEG